MTVLCDGRELRRLERWAALQDGVKFTHIALARGRTVSQPMLTLRGATPSYGEQRTAVRAFAAALAGAGFAVSRVKIECAPWSAEVPQRCEEVPAAFAETGGDGGRHFEHHVKLLLDVDQDREELAAVAVRHGAHVSWNARRRRPDGREERFVTQRCHGVGAERAGRELDALLADLAHYEVIEVEREYVLLDSGPALDEGWLETS
ncbi:hypothetical protein [uncultured Streptomyces sp.]|uniref:hypothetical protein n=1 Tax=uncultured Streptomyces sp. TaxID=174707 RepID=UPI002631F602|nr:hypothetical protein [uncultured Streptomyces sp.]